MNIDEIINKYAILIQTKNRLINEVKEKRNNIKLIDQQCDNLLSELIKN